MQAERRVTEPLPKHWRLLSARTGRGNEFLTEYNVHQGRSGSLEDVLRVGDAFLLLLLLLLCLLYPCLLYPCLLILYLLLRLLLLLPLI